MDIESFIKGILDELDDLNVIMNRILESESLLKSHLLVKYGFVLHTYAIKPEAVLQGKTIDNLQQELSRFAKLERDLLYHEKGVESALLTFEYDYSIYNGRKLPLRSILQQQLNNGYYLARLCKASLEILKQKIEAGTTFNPKKAGNQIHKLLVTIGNFLAQMKILVETDRKSVV